MVEYNGLRCIADYIVRKCNMEKEKGHGWSLFPGNSTYAKFKIIKIIIAMRKLNVKMNFELN